METDAKKRAAHRRAVGLKESEKRLQRIASELLNAQERERKLVAQELHDSLAAQLAAIKLSLERKLGSMTGESFAGPITIEEIIQNTQRAMEETRRIMANLWPSLLDDLGILPTIDWFCREFQKINPEIRIERETEIAEDEIPENLKVNIFRLLQEAMNNIHKHSQADWVKISLAIKGSFMIFHIEDNGRGLDFQNAICQKEMGKRFGLTSMKERVELSGGRFELHSAPGRGVSIRAEGQIDVT
jgi:signal transduction histidine kinase